LSLIIQARSEGHVDTIIEVARRERLDPEVLKKKVAAGRVVIPRNTRKKKARLIGIGEGLTTKVNVNVGTSGVYVDPDLEEAKVKLALEYGADTVMDLSTGGDLDAIRRRLIEAAEGLPLALFQSIKPG